MPYHLSGSHDLPGLSPQGSRLAYVGRGVVAGFVATATLSVLMVAMQVAGVAGVSIIQLLATAAGLPGQAWVGWSLHFAIGAIAWGGLFAFLHSYMPGRHPFAQGIWFGMLVWLLMMVVFMPAAEAGLFGQGLDGWAVATGTLGGHVLYGGVLGAAFAALSRAVSRSGVSAVGDQED